MKWQKNFSIPNKMALIYARKTKFSAQKTLQELKKRPASYWEKQGEKNVLSLFQYTAKTVPAYKKLLRAEGIKTSSIQTIEDFQKLPVIDKDSYLRKYKYTELFPNKDLSYTTTISATSGSTGEPFYLPRGEYQDWQYEYVAELFLRNQFEIDKKSTLGIIGFGLGIWIGGIFTYKVFNKLSSKGYRISLISTGPDKKLYLKSLKKFGRLFDQVILMGYPPFVKDIIDEAPDYGINLKKYNIKILTAAEGFSEKFREYITKKSHIKNSLADTINIYGTVELGTMAHETSLSNLVRKIAEQDKRAFAKIFPHATQLPTLAQYHPSLAYFEEINNEVVGSGYGSSIPLLRYGFRDKGGVASFDDMLAKLRNAGVDILKEAKLKNISQQILNLPFVYAYGRVDDSVVLRGANIYIDEIRNALLHKSLENHATGKFTMIKKEDKNLNGYLEINIELRKGVRGKASFKKHVQNTIIDYLRRTNSEFNDQYQSSPKGVAPKITLWPYQDIKYFGPGGKQRWIEK